MSQISTLRVSPGTVQAEFGWISITSVGDGAGRGVFAGVAVGTGVAVRVGEAVGAIVGVRVGVAVRKAVGVGKGVRTGVLVCVVGVSEGVAVGEGVVVGSSVAVGGGVAVNTIVGGGSWVGDGLPTMICTSSLLTSTPSSAVRRSVYTPAVLNSTVSRGVTVQVLPADLEYRVAV